MPKHDRSVRPQGGFTLIEVMITVAIVAILAAIAIPKYSDYVIKGKLANAINGIGAVQAQMEQYYQDNRTYANVGTGSTALLSPCNRTNTYGDFTVSCSGTPTASAYTLTVSSTKAQLAGFIYTVTQADVRTTKFGTAWGSPAQFSGCWSVTKGATSC